MTANLFVLFDARAIEDVEAASQWYSEKQQVLAIEFLNALNDTLGLVAQYPEAYVEVDFGIRRVLLKKFPYSIYYTIGSDRITVLAVLHTRRAPETWRKRLEESDE